MQNKPNSSLKHMAGLFFTYKAVLFKTMPYLHKGKKKNKKTQLSNYEFDLEKIQKKKNPNRSIIRKLF